MGDEDSDGWAQKEGETGKDMRTEIRGGKDGDKV